MRTSFSLIAVVIAGACAVIDAAATVTIFYGTGIVRDCGTTALRDMLTMFAMVGWGVVPAGIALAGIGFAALVPVLRTPKWWIVSAVVLSIVALGVVGTTAVRFPNPIAPAECDI